MANDADEGRASSVSAVDPDEPGRFGFPARMLMRAAQAGMVAFELWRGGPPEAATCAEVQASRRKLKEVAQAVYNELVGMEE